MNTPDYPDRRDKVPVQGELFQNRIGLLDAAKQVAGDKITPFPRHSGCYCPLW